VRAWGFARRASTPKVGDDPDGRAPPVSERRERSGNGLRGGTGSGKLGRAQGREGKEPTAAGPRGGEKRGSWAGPHEEKESSSSMI
jgi:hypothetical protein